jgi:hypothetical protein
MRTSFDHPGCRPPLGWPGPSLDRGGSEALPKGDRDEAGRGHDGTQKQRRRVPDACAGDGSDHRRSHTDYGSNSEHPPSTDREPGQGSKGKDQDQGHAVTILPGPQTMPSRGPQPMHPHFRSEQNVSAEMGRDRLPERVAASAEAALTEQRYVCAIDIMGGIGWLSQSAIDAWLQGRLPYLESGIQILDFERMAGPRTGLDEKVLGELRATLRIPARRAGS